MKSLWSSFWLAFSYVALPFLTACSPVYQMSRTPETLPSLKGSFLDAVGNFLHNGKGEINRKKIFQQAFVEFGLTGVSVSNLTQRSFDRCPVLPDIKNCIPIADASSSGSDKSQGPSSPAVSKGASPKPPSPNNGIPAPAAAILECVYWTYKQDTSSINQNTLATILGLGVLAGGVAAATQGAKPGAVAALAATGAGTALASWQKSLAPIVSVTSHNVSQETMAYYPIFQARVDRMYDELKGHFDEPIAISLVAELWDVAGSACPGGVLKGRSWFNNYAK
jgi:hypothetical protein